MSRRPTSTHDRGRHVRLAALLAFASAAVLVLGMPSRAAAQTIVSGADQVFGIGQAATAISPITITDAAVPVITAGGNIRIHIPTTFNMAWDQTVTTATITGSGAAKVSTTLSYPDSRTLLINVATNFAANDQIVVSGLRFSTFTAASAASNLWMDINNNNVADATDIRTITVVVPTLTGGADQAFTVGDPATATTAMTVTEAAVGTIKVATGLRLRIPLTFNMQWNTAVTTVTLGGSGAAKVSSTVTYEDAGHTVVLAVTANFSAADVLTISGLQYANFTAVSAADNIELVVTGAGGAAAGTSNRSISIFNPLSITSQANQTFAVNTGATNMSQVTITAGAQAPITPATGIRIRIPAGVFMLWDQTVTTAALGGSAAAKVSAAVTYEDAGKTVVLSVTANFTGVDVLTIHNLRFASFTNASTGSLQLVVSGSGGATGATDPMTKTIVGPTISSAANQVFHVGDPVTAASAITITDANPPTIKGNKDIRIKIPATFNMTWDPTMTTPTFGGSGAAKMNAGATYANGNRTVVLNVRNNFNAGDQLIVTGLRFTNFTALSAASNMTLEVTNSGNPEGIDDKTIVIIATLYSPAIAPASASVSRIPTNGTNVTQDFTLTNNGSISDSYDLLTSKKPGTALAVVSITGASITQGANPDSARRATLAAGVSATVTVTYSVANVAMGTIDTLILTARSVGSPAATSVGKLAVTVIKPSITVSSAVNPNGTQLPGTDLTFTSTVTNVGSASAASLAVVDSVPTWVQFQLSSASASLPAGVTVATEYSNNLGVTWTYVPVSAGCSAPAGFDRCVNRIRWRLLTALSNTAPNNQGTLSFVARIK